MMKTRLVALAAGVALVALAGCAKTLEQRGNLPAAEKLDEIQAGVSTKDDVSRLLGSPSSQGTFDENTWYYISRRTEQFAFLAPEVVDQQVVAIQFDDAGTVRGVEKHGFDEKRDIKPVARATPAAGKELSFIEQLLGNVGKFNAPGARSNNPADRGGGGGGY